MCGSKPGGLLWHKQTSCLLLGSGIHFSAGLSILTPCTCALACNMDVSYEAHCTSLWTSHPAVANHSPTKHSGFKPPPLCSFSLRPQWVGRLELPGLRALVCGHQMLAGVPSAKDHPYSQGSHPWQALRDSWSPYRGLHTTAAVSSCCVTQEPFCPSLRRHTAPPAGFHRPCASSLIQIGRGQGSLGHVRSWLFYTLLSCSY